jgi:hypothetical protein
MQNQLIQSCHTGSFKKHGTGADGGQNASATPLFMLLYKRSGEPVEVALWVLPIQNVALAATNVAAVCVANVTAARCKRVERLTLGRLLGSGAFGRVHIGVLLLLISR